MGYAYTVDVIDKSKVGLIILNCSVTTFTDNDDRDNEIADRWLYEVKHSYTIEATNIDTSTEKGKTLQFSVVVKDNGTIIENPTIIYSVNNSNCSVDATGLITANNIGTSIITATFTADDGTVKSVSITITVTEPVVVNNYTISISGSDIITAGNSEDYSVIVKNNGVQVDLPVTWQLLNEDFTTPTPVSIAYLSNITDKTCTVNGVEQGNYVELKAILQADTSKIATIEIFIGGGW